MRCYAHSPLIFLEFLQAARKYSFKGTFEERTPSRRDPMAWTTAIVFEILFERSARLGQLLPGQTVIVSTTIWDIVGHIGRDLENLASEPKQSTPHKPLSSSMQVITQKCVGLYQWWSLDGSRTSLCSVYLPELRSTRFVSESLTGCAL